jgi:hypothetical protein
MRLVKPVGSVSIYRLNAYKYSFIKEGGSANSQINITSVCIRFLENQNDYRASWHVVKSNF